MTLFDLLQRAKEENEKNLHILQILGTLKQTLDETTKIKIELLNEDYVNGKIDAETRQKNLEKINQSASDMCKRLEVIYAPQTKYNDMCATLRDCGAFISNQMMCSILKTLTHTNWAYVVVEESPKMARLYFRNDAGEEYRPQAGILERDGNLDFVIKKLENINWLQEYLNATPIPCGNLLQTQLVTGQKGFLFSPLLQEALERFFQHVKIDPLHPENLSLECGQKEEPQKFKPNNLYHRYQRDKKAGKFDKNDENLDKNDGKF